jgi:hypothetical protein
MNDPYDFDERDPMLTDGDPGDEHSIGDPSAAPPASRAAPKKARKPRRANDAYPTVDELATAIVRRVADVASLPERVVEPTSGDGSFVRAVRAVYGAPRVVAVDIEEKYEGSNVAAGAKFVHADFLGIDDSALASADLIVGNPPFNIAAQIVAKCVRAAPRAVIAFLLPVGFVGRTKERDGAYWKANPVRYYAALHPRPSFTGDGRTDRMEYALIGFGPRAAWGGDATDIYGEPIVWRPE